MDKTQDSQSTMERCWVHPTLSDVLCPLDRDIMAQDQLEPVGFFHFGLIPEEKMFGVLRLEH